MLFITKKREPSNRLPKQNDKNINSISILQQSRDGSKEEYKLNKFIEAYKSLRKRGYDESEAFGLVSGYIATDGTFDDLKRVHKVYKDDHLNEFDKLIKKAEGYLNEKDSITQSQVG